MSTAELLQVLEKANLRNLRTVLSQQMQQAQDSCYDIHIPKQLTEEWVQEHVHEVFMDDRRALDLLCRSVHGNDPATKLNKLLAYQPLTQVFYGYELRLPVTKKDNTVYQDGSAVTKNSVKLFHPTRQGLLHNILKRGVQASIPSHGTEGLWTFAGPSS